MIAPPSANGNGNGSGATPPPAEEKGFVLRSKRSNKKVKVWEIDLNEKKTKHYLNGNSFLLPDATPCVFLPVNYSPPLKLLKSEIDDHVPGYGGPSLVNEINPIVGWHVMCCPKTGEYAGETIQGIVFMTDAFVAEA